MIFDSHAHYDDEAFDGDRDELLAGLAAQGVGAVVNVSADLISADTTLELTNKWDFIYGTAGVHPSDTEKLDRAGMEHLEQILSQPKIAAVGEIGLDYHWPDPERGLQQEWFYAQLELAKSHDAPIVIHSREAAKDTFDIMKAAGGAGLSAVIHCFSYEKEMAREFLRLGYYIGIGGVLTFKNARKLREVVAYMPMEAMLLETDCPYMAPVPFRGKRNDSAKLHEVVRAISQIRGISDEEVEAITWQNACRFYRISL